MISSVHPAYQAPAFGAVTFLNEIMNKYPSAISFAPGAPNPALLETVDLNRYIDCFIEYLVTNHSLTHKRARRLVYEYGPTKGIINDVLAKGLSQDYGINVSAESIVITVGAQEAMLLALRALYPDCNARLAVVAPTYPGIIGAAHLLDIPLISIDEDIDGVDIDKLAFVCQKSKQENKPIRALYVAPDFANPSGSQMSLHKRHQLLHLADEYDLILLEDNTYHFTAPVDSRLPSLKALDTHKRVILIGSFAKICLPGVRVGYLVANQIVNNQQNTQTPLADILAKMKGMTTVNTPPICQAIVGGMLLSHQGSLQALEHEKRALYCQNLSTLLNELNQYQTSISQDLNGITWNNPAGGFFISVNLPIAADYQLLEYSALKHGVLWTPMSVFYLNDQGKNQLRLSCSYLSIAEIKEGTKRLVDFFRSINKMKQGTADECCV